MRVSPTITVSSTPGLVITTGLRGLSYEAILNSMGIFVYDINTLYYAADSVPQINNPIQFAIYDSSGTASSFLIVNPISATQYQPSMFIRTSGVILDGQSGLNFDLLAGKTAQFIFYGNTKANEDYIDEAGGINNFKEIEELIGREGFFE
jgi:hypothetical protein